MFTNYATISARLVESIFSGFSKLIKKPNGPSRLWLRIHCDVPITAKGSQTRLGGGKGSINR